ncbi:MAG TPA: ATP-binding protein, partial [Blastocatellia bacterium]|nr:ATP-binding protein [Blastocatellia bacterium]
RPDDTETLRHAVTVIERNARFQTRLVNDLLDMSRIESGKMAISIQPCDLNAAVASVVESLRNDAASRGISISSDLSADRMIVPADPARLEQILNNLLVNALKFTDEGGRIAVSTERRDDMAALLCTDTGIGIDEEFLPYVFDRFRQADNSTRRRHSGLGLGLSIVRSLVDMHGGSIEARSEGPGQGTTFVVELPLVATRSPGARGQVVMEKDQTGGGEQGMLPGLRVLVVEDDSDTLEMMRALCERQGLSVMDARSVGEALEAVTRFRPDLIISDISLSGIDGLEFARRLRSEARFRQIPMIALSGLVSDEYRARVREAGFDLHLGKPIAFESFFGAVNELLRSKTQDKAESKSAERSD